MRNDMPSWFRAPVQRLRLALRKHRAFPRPFERIALAGKSDLVGVEIGVYRGEHAVSLGRHCKRLYLVDPYLPYTDFSQAEMNAAKRIAECRCRSNKFWWKQTESLIAAQKINEPLDFVYLDGDHSHDAVLMELITYWPKVMDGGLIGGHDIYNGECPQHDGVVRAVVHFASAKNVQLYIESPDWWIYKKQ